MGNKHSSSMAKCEAESTSCFCCSCLQCFRKRKISPEQEEIFIDGKNIGGKLKSSVRQMENGQTIFRHILEIPSNSAGSLAAQMELKNGDELLTLDQKFLPSRKQEEVLALFKNMVIGKEKDIKLTVGRNTDRTDEANTILLGPEVRIQPMVISTENVENPTKRKLFTVTCHVENIEGDFQVDSKTEPVQNDQKGTEWNLWQYEVPGENIFIHMHTEDEEVKVAPIQENQTSPSHHILKTIRWFISSSKPDRIQYDFVLSNKSKSHYINTTATGNKVFCSRDEERYVGQVSKRGSRISFKSAKTGLFIRYDRTKDGVKDGTNLRASTDKYEFEQSTPL